MRRKTEKQSTIDFECQLPADLTAVPDTVEKVIQTLLAQHYRISTFEFRLALFESLANAIKHGNKNKQNQPVKLKLIATPAHIIIEVKDKGRGFDCRQVLASPPPSNSNSTSGRGLQLLRAYGFNPTYSNSDTTLTLTKKL